MIIWITHNYFVYRLIMLIIVDSLDYIAARLDFKSFSQVNKTVLTQLPFPYFIQHANEITDDLFMIDLPVKSKLRKSATMALTILMTKEPQQSIQERSISDIKDLLQLSEAWESKYLRDITLLSSNLTQISECVQDLHKRDFIRIKPPLQHCPADEFISMDILHNIRGLVSNDSFADHIFNSVDHLFGFWKKHVTNARCTACDILITPNQPVLPPFRKIIYNACCDTVIHSVCMSLWKVTHYFQHCPGCKGPALEEIPGDVTTIKLAPTLEDITKAKEAALIETLWNESIFFTDLDSFIDDVIGNSPDNMNLTMS